MQAHAANSRQLAHCAVGYVADTTQSPQNCCMHVAHEGATSRRVVHVLQHKDSRCRTSKNVVPQIASTMEMVTTDRRLTSPQTCRYGVSDHRSLIWENAA